MLGHMKLLILVWVGFFEFLQNQYGMNMILFSNFLDNSSDLVVNEATIASNLMVNEVEDEVFEELNKLDFGRFLNWKIGFKK